MVFALSSIVLKDGRARVVVVTKFFGTRSSSLGWMELCWRGREDGKGIFGYRPTRGYPVRSRMCSQLSVFALPPTESLFCCS